MSNPPETGALGHADPGGDPGQAAEPGVDPALRELPSLDEVLQGSSLDAASVRLMKDRRAWKQVTKALPYQISPAHREDYIDCYGDLVQIKEPRQIMDHSMIFFDEEKVQVIQKMDTTQKQMRAILDTMMRSEAGYFYFLRALCFVKYHSIFQGKLHRKPT